MQRRSVGPNVIDQRFDVALRASKVGGGEEAVVEGDTDESGRRGQAAIVGEDPPFLWLRLVRGNRTAVNEDHHRPPFACGELRRQVDVREKFALAISAIKGVALDHDVAGRRPEHQRHPDQLSGRWHRVSHGQIRQCREQRGYPTVHGRTC